LTRKGRSFGKIGIGPISWFFGNSRPKPLGPIGNKTGADKRPSACSAFENIAIEALRSDEEMLRRLRRNGVPWRGIQERIKEALPEGIYNRNEIAYNLVPKAMNAIFGRQGATWKAERRPSKNSKGYTTWLIAAKFDA